MCIRDRDGTGFNYSVSDSPMLGSDDLMRDYTDTMRAAGIGTGVYFQLFYDYWLGYLHGSIQPNGPTAPKLTADQFFNVSLQMLQELWGNYGPMSELWFDGGLVGWSQQATDHVTHLMGSLQPNAVAFQGPTATNGVRWIGNENGHAAEESWLAANDSMDNGQGRFDGPEVVPPEADTPFATGESIWWWAPGQTFKSLDELKLEYDNSVGHGANLLLGLTPDFSGKIPEPHVERYRELGDWIRKCYSAPAAERRNVPVGVGTSVVMELNGDPVDRNGFVKSQL
eukprot:TRINITY_DN16644_c0_g1_i5.p1 TRINITY_DN16644_c0_g1~~TRINITY_DN16644_c0_g1_i5.p1  ORF type:complete len:283 (-),score=61.68 TRINITY_DN16644_c0_g1_i5:801-1649(-)